MNRQGMVSPSRLLGRRFRIAGIDIEHRCVAQLRAACQQAGAGQLAALARTRTGAAGIAVIDWPDEPLGTGHHAFPGSLG